MSLELVTPPTDKPVTLAQLKDHLRIEQGWTEEDNELTNQLDAAIAYVDGYYGILGRALEIQEWNYITDVFPCGAQPMLIPLGPVLTVVQVAYDDSDGVVQIIDPADYELDLTSNRQWILIDIDIGWPSPTFESANSVRINFTAVYVRNGDASTVPDSIQQAIKLLAQHFYDRKGEVIPPAIGALLDPWRWLRV